MSKYALYLIAVEDTEENDMAVMNGPLEWGDRVAGNLSEEEAKDIRDDIIVDYGNTDIAR